MIGTIITFVCLIIAFTQGYARIQYPAGFKGVGPFDLPAIQKEKRKGWRIVAACFLFSAIGWAASIWLLTTTGA